MPIQLDYEKFKEKVFDYDSGKEFNFKGDKPAIIDFWAEWCGPCKMTEPVVDEIDQENSDVDVMKVNVDEYPYIPAMFGVQSVPTFMFISTDNDVRSATGAITKESFENAISVYLRKEKSEEEVQKEQENDFDEAREENNSNESKLVDKNGNALN